MALSDIQIALTARKDSPLAGILSRPKVYYLKASDLAQMDPDTVRGATVLRIRNNAGTFKKVEVYETPNQVMAMQALSQGATAAINFGPSVNSAQTATGSTAGAALVINKYFTEVNAGNGLGVLLPDPFVQRLAVIQNTTTGSINVFPSRLTGGGTAAQIDGSTATFVLKAGKRKHFLAPTAATANTTAPWKTAIDA